MHASGSAKEAEQKVLHGKSAEKGDEVWPGDPCTRTLATRKNGIMSFVFNTAHFSHHDLCVRMHLYHAGFVKPLKGTVSWCSWIQGHLCPTNSLVQNRRFVQLAAQDRFLQTKCGCENLHEHLEARPYSSQLRSFFAAGVANRLAASAFKHLFQFFCITVLESCNCSFSQFEIVQLRTFTT